MKKVISSSELNTLALSFQDSGDQKFFIEIYSNCHQKILAFTKRILSCDRITANEVAQNVLIKIFNSLQNKTYRGDGFISWIYVITKNECTDFLLKKRRRTYYLYEETHQYLLPIDHETPDFILQYKEKVSEVMKYVSTLSQRNKEIYLLYSKGKKSKEMANILAMTETTVKTHLYIVRKKIREIITHA